MSYDLWWIIIIIIIWCMDPIARLCVLWAGRFYDTYICLFAIVIFCDMIIWIWRSVERPSLPNRFFFGYVFVWYGRESPKIS